MTLIKKLWIGIGVLILLSPIGLILPDWFKAGAAWGEWGAEEMQELVGYIPQGLEKLSSLWNAPLPDYAFQGWEERGLAHLSIAYIFSAVVGIAVTVGIVFAIGKFLVRRED
ncbi:TPA: cobalamin biosynthesis protein [bacterium]|nr:MAG: cobalamin biosynthesis protein [Candidatus Hydrogenedentes bacterium CG07_land_8_20_14_0_80_42_17]HBW46985.1 cobalamin biosynthesis protein [bacterium]